MIRRKSQLIYMNLKTGTYYEYLGEVENATNAQAGQVMVEYRNKQGEKFVREKSEFAQKFTFEPGKFSL